jgi:hypothetical protein
VGGASPPFTLFTITYKVAVYAPAERADTLTLFHLYSYLYSVDQPQTVASGVVFQGWRHGMSITYKMTPCWVTLLQPARRVDVLGQPLAFGLIVCSYVKECIVYNDAEG